MRLRVHTEVIRDSDTDYPYRVTLTRRRIFTRIDLLEKRFEDAVDAAYFVRGIRTTAEILGVDLVLT